VVNLHHLSAVLTDGQPPACPADGFPSAVPSGPPVALWTHRRSVSSRPVARLPALRSVRPAGCPADPLGVSPPAVPTDGRPSAVPSGPPVARWAFRRAVSGLSGGRLPVRRPAASAGCPVDPSEGRLLPVRRAVARASSRLIHRLPGRPARSRPRPSRRTVARPPFRPARRLPGEPSGGLPPALPTHGCPPVVPRNPPVSRQIPWIPGPHVAISGGRGAAASKRRFSRGQTRAGGKEPEGRRHEPFGCGPWRPKAPPATSVGRPVSLSTRGFPSRSARSARRPPALSGTFRPDASRT